MGWLFSDPVEGPGTSLAILLVIGQLLATATNHRLQDFLPGLDGTVVRSPVERMARPRLAATHQDIARIATGHKPVPAQTGLLDIRAILHCHAQDSTHTGGTREGLLAAAKKTGVQVILLSNHFRPPNDFWTNSWHGLRDGVLFLPGSEYRGFLIQPTRSVMSHMEGPEPEFLRAALDQNGLAFLSHVEERLNHPLNGLTGLEIYNRHADAMQDPQTLAILLLEMTSLDGYQSLKSRLKDFPDELFSAQVQHAGPNLAKWDRETPHLRATGIAADDCHENMTILARADGPKGLRFGTNVDKPNQLYRIPFWFRPGLRRQGTDAPPGQILQQLELDPYDRAFRSTSTHLLASELSEPAVRQALQEGRAYVSHDFMGDPTGFRFDLTDPAGGRILGVMGSEHRFQPGTHLRVESPLPARLRLLRNGKTVATADGSTLDHVPTQAGVYRLEAWLTLDNERRPWVYTNPIYLR